MLKQNTWKCMMKNKQRNILGLRKEAKATAICGIKLYKGTN